MPEIQTPPLAVYKSISDYTPSYADFVICSRWFKTLYGVVIDYDIDNKQVAIAIEGTPRLLFTTQADEIIKVLRMFDINDIRNRKKGCWYVQKTSDGQNVWYI